MNKVFVGTSGWSYNHWQGIFYPDNLPKTKWLEFYCQHFDTVEVNSTFYRLPREKTVRNWVQKTPSNFTFTVKASRFITHLKQLKDAEESLERFLQVVGWFGKKLGPILFQFSPRFEKNVGRLNEFLGVLVAANSSTRRVEKRNPTGFSLAAAFEFRHPSWFCPEIYSLLRKYNLALCFSDTPLYPYCEEVTADFVYLRLHGHERLYASRYTKTQLDEYAKKIREWKKRVGDVYCYFDNDANAYAVENSKELRNKISNF